MFYYIALFLVILLVSVITIWMYRGIVSLGRVAQTAMLPTRRKISAKTKARLKSRQKLRGKTNVARDGSSEIPTPWGWRDEAHTVHSQPTKPATNKPGSDRGLWSGSSRQSAINENSAGYSASSGRCAPDYSKPEQKASKQRVGWPYREDKTSFAGKAYKVNRKAAEDNDINTEGKPWVW